jgi:hypothetical protein
LWSEAESLQKLETAMRAHGRAFDGLAELLRKKGRLCVVIGNHDLDFAWPAVQARLRERLGNPDREQLRFTIGEERFKGVVIEHGYSFTPENCPKDPKRFIHTWAEDSRQYLERVWGTDFMLQFYNDLERTHPFADNVKPMISVLYHGLKNRWVGGTELVRLLVFLRRRGLPWSAIASSVLSNERIDATTLAGALEEDQWKAAFIERLQSDPSFEKELERAVVQLSPADRAVLAHEGTVRTELDQGELVGEAPGQVMGIFRDGRERRAAKRWLAERDVTHVVFGHTHVAVDGDLDGRLFNTGTWLPHLDLADEGVRGKIKRHGLTLEMLNERSLYTAERLAVRIIEEPQLASRVELIRV